MLDQLDQQLNSSEGSPNSSSQQSQEGASESQKPSGNTPADSESGKPTQNEEGSQPNSGSKSQGKPSSQGVQEALKESADEIASRLQSERLANREAAKQRSNNSKKRPGEPGGQPDDRGITQNPPTGNSALPKAILDAGNNWGRLREKRADDLTEGRREVFDPEFSDAIRAYYRALGKQSSEKP